MSPCPSGDADAAQSPLQNDRFHSDGAAMESNHPSGWLPRPAGFEGWRDFGCIWLRELDEADVRHEPGQEMGRPDRVDAPLVADTRAHSTRSTEPKGKGSNPVG